jgi:tetraacyldisaccharide 4'-kinase
LNVPVIVGGDRYKAGLLAESRFKTQLHLLDDGFQHRRLHRDFDIVMLPPADLEDSLLPLGRLREPLSALARADAVVSSDELGPLTANMKRFWRVRRELRLDADVKNAIAFCGIARPDQFFAQLTRTGASLVETVSFGDHHHYRREDIARLLAMRDRTGSTGFITTEKDLMNLGAMLEKLQPLHVARLEMTFDNPGAVLRDLLPALNVCRG